MSVSLKHSQTGLIKTIPTGFSFTTFFFGFLVHVVRGQWGPALITWFTFNLASFYYCFAGNKLYAKALIEQGYVPASDIDQRILAESGIVIHPVGAPKVA